MSENQRPLPNVTPETERYWRAAADGQLLLRKCVDCRLIFCYPRALCPNCFGDAEWVEARGTGTVYSYSVAHEMAGWPEDDLPLVVAYVELDEGPRMITNVLSDPDEVSVSTSVEAEFLPTEREDVAIPVFHIVDD